MEVEEECVFHTGPDQVRLETETNGDLITIRNLDLNQAQATSLAWLINDSSVELEFMVKVKGT